MTAPAIEPHHVSVCPCREQLDLTLEQLAGIHDAYIVDEESEPEPQPLTRTATACTVTGCACVEYDDGVLIAGWWHCKVPSCRHTSAMHKARQIKITKGGGRR